MEEDIQNHSPSCHGSWDCTRGVRGLLFRGWQKKNFGPPPWQHWSPPLKTPFLKKY